MRDYKDFINSSERKNLELISSKDLATRIGHSLVASSVSISSSDSDQFGDEAVKLATSDEVITELSDSIGSPRESESEDDFVSRAKSSLTDILKKKLMG